MYELAKGRVWSGRDAHERNLIDELGGFDVAIELARKLAELDEGAPLVVVPRQRTFFEQLMEQSGSSVGIAKVLTGDVSLVLPGEDEIRAWLRWVGRPQVQARMPDILLR
jgi:ClpP class serine protease